MPALALCILLAGACSPTPSISPASTSIESAAPSGAAMTIACRPDTPAEPALRGDPCPDAIAAVELSVAPVRLPIERLVIEPGPVYCDVIWPGATTAPACF